MIRPLTLAALLAGAAGCRAPLAPQRAALTVAPDSSVTLTVATIDTATTYTLAVRGYGHYDRAGGFFLTGTFADSLLLHGTYCGEDVPLYHDFLWLSDPASCAFQAVVQLAVSRTDTQDRLTVSIPFQVVPPGPRYQLRVRRIDENGERAYLIRAFDGMAL